MKFRIIKFDSPQQDKYLAQYAIKPFFKEEWISLIAY